jgi:histidinol dehydrogenase
MKRKEILEHINKSLKHFETLENVTDKEIGYTRALKHIKQLLEKQMKDTIVESVIEQFKQRSEIGIKKYNTTLDRTDLTRLEWLQHAQEEAMDLILYLEKLKQYENK